MNGLLDTEKGGKSNRYAVIERIDPLLASDQQFVAHIDQRVGEFRVDVKRLVGRNGPRGGGPDHDRCRLAQGCQAKGLGQLGFMCCSLLLLADGKIVATQADPGEFKSAVLLPVHQQAAIAVLQVEPEGVFI